MKSLVKCVRNIYYNMKSLSEQKIENLAKFLHERYMQQAQTDHRTPSSLPYKWDNLPEAIKERNRAQVRAFPMLIEQYGTNDIETLARGVHECWMKDYADKSDPRMVDYDELSETEKGKDRVVVKNLLLLMGEYQ